MAHEFRQDPVSGAWVLIAPGRARRPDATENGRQWRDSYQKPEDCPFESLSSMGEPLLVSDMVTVVRNAYPAVHSGVCGESVTYGPFLIQIANGFHELVITRDHERHFTDFSVNEVSEVLRAYQQRYRAISQDDCGDYISIFHNYRREAGASVWHNHSQILSTPIVPPEVMRSVQGADRYFREHGRTIHDMLIAWELEQVTRIVYENDRFVVLCPFASKAPYEMQIFPKQHSARFEEASSDDLAGCAQALGVALRSLHGALGDPPFNFYIHTAPAQKDPTVDNDSYHWHIEIVPKLKLNAGFESATGLFINPVDPDDAAAQLRSTL